MRKRAINAGTATTERLIRANDAARASVARSMVHRVFQWTAVVLAVIPWAGTTAAQVPAEPPAEHPRLLLRMDDVEAIRASLGDPAVAHLWEEVRRRAAVPEGYVPEARYDQSLVEAAEANAFLSLIHDDRAAARRAIDLVFRFLDDDRPFAGRHVNTRIVGYALFVLAEVYDWCHDALTDEEKARMIAAVPKHGQRMEIKFPPSRLSTVIGHAGEAQLFRDLLGVGIAMADEAPEYYEQTAGLILREFAPPRKFSQASHVHNQGNGYGPYRYFWELWASLLFTQMDQPSPFDLAHLKRVPEWLLQLRRPDGGQVIDGDDYQAWAHAAGVFWGAPRPPMWDFITGYFREPQYALERQRVNAVVHPRGAQLEEPILSLLLRPDRVPVATQEPPLTRVFGEPFGAMFARTGWSVGPDSRDALAYLKIGTHQFGNHQHADSGQFQLYYRGSLAIDSGQYDKYRSPHFLHYFQRSIAHNTLLIETDDEASRFVDDEIGNDGGQRYLIAGRDALNNEDFWNDDRRVARVVSQYVGPDPDLPAVSLIKGDLTRAYAPQKAERVTRTFAFLPLKDSNAPTRGDAVAALVVLDHVESVRDDQRKVFLLHSIEEPDVQGAVTTIKRTGPQTDLLSLQPAKIRRVSDVEAELVFDLTPWRDERLIRADLLAFPRFGPATGIAADASVSGAEPRPSTPLHKWGGAINWEEITPWLETARKRETSLVIRLTWDPANPLDFEQALRAPYLRAWVEREPFGGKLVQKTLLPVADDLVIKTVGGPGREFWSVGKNWPVKTQDIVPHSAEEPGAWRVEVSAKSPDRITRFLNVEQVLDADGQPAAVRRIEDEGVLGVVIADRILVASPDGTWIRDGARFTIRPEDVGPDGRALLVMTDLPPGDHALWQDERLAALVAIEAPSHTWVTQLPAGTYELRSRPIEQKPRG